MATELMPALFMSHGAGPAWFLDGDKVPAMKLMDKNSKSAKFLRNMVQQHAIPKPKAVLVVSAHWEEKEFTVSTKPKPALYYDYYGFPDETYNLKWCPPGAPEVAKKTALLLEKKGIKCLQNSRRDLDHGVFVPLSLTFPSADIPVFQLSLKKTMDLESHLAVGEALEPLRQEGVLIIGSGSSTHSNDGHAFDKKYPTPAWKDCFMRLLNDAVTGDAHTSDDRKRKLADIIADDTYKKAHPTPDHFMPLPVIMAAAGLSPGRILYEETIGCAFVMSTYIFN